MIMYKRNEEIEEENLDWDKSSKDTAHVKEKEEPSSPEMKREQMPFNNNTKPKISANMKKNVTAYFNGNEYLWLGLFILVIPYLVGFLFNAVLFYIYSGISIVKVFGIVIEYKVLELWSIGAYTFVTIGIVLILLKAFNDRRG